MPWKFVLGIHFKSGSLDKHHTYWSLKYADPYIILPRKGQSLALAKYHQESQFATVSFPHNLTELPSTHSL